ncbi:N-acetylmuramoyl-L-alanine amidase [Paenibacillus macerans]|uniref:N-acetylmuramoyl-L-alanine amidase n=1 Tax=Paenibacillus macerans TaxID=44252 RepID=UPI0020401C80|nr:N-acetylmuramoyl-L-alanine amidase [Paenibacillus macerans]MCM3703786.1 N-acetylmuramoyl-L-alanine amidase [Paenibacillus macerans]
MYDFLISVLEAIFRHGWSLSSAGAIIFVLLKQRSIKKRLKKYFPWMFAEENDVRAYATNQLIIMENQRRIMIKMGVDPCADGPMTKFNVADPKNSNTLLNLLQPAIDRGKLRRKNMKTIVIDAGHGGKDPGASGTTGTHEKDFALTMAKKLADRFSGSQVAAVLTRQNDVYLELSTRAQIANDLKADAFISIHANSTSTMPGSASGTETWYTRPDSKTFAEVLHKHMASATGLRDRGVKVGNLAVTRETKMPAALLEVAFINHPVDEIKLFDPTFQDKVVDAVAKAILEYFKESDRPTPIDDVDYPKMEIMVRAHEDQTFTGYNIKNTTWIPSRPIGELCGAKVGYTKKKVTINGAPLETQLINGLGYVKARDFGNVMGAKVFWDKSNPNRVDIYKGA